MLETLTLKLEFKNKSQRGTNTLPYISLYNETLYMYLVLHKREVVNARNRILFNLRTCRFKKNQASFKT